MASLGAENGHSLVLTALALDNGGGVSVGEQPHYQSRGWHLAGPRRAVTTTGGVVVVAIVAGRVTNAYQ